MNLSSRTAALLAACTASFAAFAARPTSLRQLAILVALLLLAATFLGGSWQALREWKTRRLATLVLPLLAACAMPAGIGLGRAWRAWAFSQDQPAYAQAAQWAASQAHGGSTVLLQLPPEFQDLAYAIDVQDDPLCGTVVDFVWGSGFPVRHVIRRYVPASSSARCGSPHGHARQLAEHWYEYVR